VKNIIISFFYFIIIIFGISCSSYGAIIPKINLSWVSSVENIYTFKLYISYSADMSGKIYHGECGDYISTVTNEYSMTCTNIPADRFPLFIQISAVVPGYQEEVVSNVQEVEYSPVSPTIVNIK